MSDSSSRTSLPASASPRIRSNNGPNLNDSGCCFGVFTSLDFARPDGKPFSLKEIDISSTRSSWYSEIAFTPAAPEGVYLPTQWAELDVAYDNILLRGRKTDGTVVSAAVNSFLNSTYVGGPGAPDQDRYGFRSPLVLDPETAATLSDLDYLSVEIGFSTELGLISRKDFEEEFFRSRAGDHRGHRRTLRAGLRALPVLRTGPVNMLV